MGDGNTPVAVCYWGLDSTFWIHRKVFIQTIFEIKQCGSFKGFYESNGHVVCKVEIQGVVVSVDEREKVVTYKVDDGTGIVSCCCWRDTIEDSFSLGQTVIIQGKITEYRNERQLTVDLITQETNLNAECLFWLDVVNLTRTLYRTPFDPPASCLQKDQTQSTTESLLDVIDQLKYKGKLRFPFVELCSLDEVEKIKETLISMNTKQDEATREHKQVADGNKLLRRVLSELENQGEVFYKDAERDEYEIITHKYHLKPAIMKAIKDISEGSEHDSAHVSRIIDVVHSDQDLSQVPGERIQQSLNKLMEDSEIYEGSDDIYCLV